MSRKPQVSYSVSFTDDAAIVQVWHDGHRHLVNCGGQYMANCWVLPFYVLKNVQTLCCDFPSKVMETIRKEYREQVQVGRPWVILYTHSAFGMGVFKTHGPTCLDRLAYFGQHPEHARSYVAEYGHLHDLGEDLSGEYQGEYVPA